jgi:putative selenate reductase
MDLADLTARKALSGEGFAEFAALLRWTALTDSGLALSEDDCGSLSDALSGDDSSVADRSRGWAQGMGFDEERTDVLVDLVVAVLARLNLRRYAQETRTDPRYRKGTYRTDRSKTGRVLGLFDCIKAPCTDECPVDQKVPEYMEAVRNCDFAAAVRLTREDNPLPSILGQVCDHLCENTCVRTHLDQPLAIRHIKRFIMEQERQPVDFHAKPGRGPKVAIIGAGPAGLSAAQLLGYAGFSVTIFEAHAYPGGMVGGAIPAYRLPQTSIDADMAALGALGVEIVYGQRAGVDLTLETMRTDGFDAVFVAVGAQLAKRLGLPGEDAEGVMDALRFLRSVREGDPLPIGARVGVIGAGDTAMDAVRSALRVGASEASLIYRRTVDQMPADPEEVQACREEGVRIIEQASPQALHVEEGRLVGLVCARTEYRGERDAAGRKVPYDVPDSTFEIPLDSLILAISQHSVLDFFGKAMPTLTSRGYIDVDPFTFETSLPGIYAGGDVAGDGPSSIVRAAADGKAVARAIIDAHAGLSPRDSIDVAVEPAPVDLAKMLVRRAHREYRAPITFTPTEQRDGFDQTVLGYSAEEAKAEASRCLDCHQICSLCVGVCPNMALMTYETEPFAMALADLRVDGRKVVPDGRHAYRAEQRLQIAVLTDFCNECGNCSTACPTSGDPYRDKPRLYLDRADFEAQQDNAFMVFAGRRIEGRWNGETHGLVVDGHVQYTSPSLNARLEPGTLELLDGSVGAGASDGQALSLKPAAEMYVLLRGLEGSMGHLPLAVPGSGAGTRLSHPGYAE